MRHMLRKAPVWVLIVAGALPLPAPAADPLVMLLLGIAREMVISHAMREASRHRPQVAIAPQVYPGTTVEPAQLKRLIDECFGYLSEAQREEIFAALHAWILDPKNAAIRASTIEYFAQHALSVRALRERLAQLSVGDKRRIAAEFHSELASMPPEEQMRLGEVLRKGLLPVPDDLGQMLLAALER